MGRLLVIIAVCGLAFVVGAQVADEAIAEAAAAIVRPHLS